jgi:hypothetical protein
VTARRLFYAGWAIGVVGLLLTVIEDWLGALMIPAGLLLLGAAFADLGGQMSFPGGRTFFNLVLALVGLGWIAFGVAVAVA